MLEQLPYCGLPPAPGELLARFNTDPLLLVALALLGLRHVRSAPRCSGERLRAAMGWIIASAAFISPLCALSVSLFCARVAQHMVLILLAAPLIASAWPRRGAGSSALWLAASFFFIALWFWHMPVPYDATFSSTAVYWAMHTTLFGSSILLWRELLHHRQGNTANALLAGALTSMQMGLLGAIITFAAHPLFLWHLTTTAAWGLTPLRDQQLGGVLMWVPGIVLFLWAAIRSLERLWSSLEGVKPA